MHLAPIPSFGSSEYRFFLVEMKKLGSGVSLPPENARGAKTLMRIHGESLAVALARVISACCCRTVEYDSVEAMIDVGIFQPHTECAQHNFCQSSMLN